MKFGQFMTRSNFADRERACYQECLGQGYGDKSNLDGDSDGSHCATLQGFHVSVLEAYT
jgi:hypothetical protein